jgi:hypothetical protein
MSQLQQFLPKDVSPADLLVVALVFYANAWKFVNSQRERRLRAATATSLTPQTRFERLIGMVPEGRLERMIGLLLDTLEAIVIMLCIWLVGRVLDHTLPGRTMGGISLAAILDCAHFAVMFNWLLQCLRRFMP